VCGRARKLGLCAIPAHTRSTLGRLAALLGAHALRACPPALEPTFAPERNGGGFLPPHRWSLVSLASGEINNQLAKLVYIARAFERSGMYRRIAWREALYRNFEPGSGTRKIVSVYSTLTSASSSSRSRASATTFPSRIATQRPGKRANASAGTGGGEISTTAAMIPSGWKLLAGLLTIHTFSATLRRYLSKPSRTWMHCHA
jgi:hypothetical protein